MDTPSPRVAPLADDQVDPAGRVLARAFADDPLVRYLFPEETARARVLEWHFTALVRFGRLAGQVYVATAAEAGAGGAVCGAAVWIAAGLPDERDPVARLERLERSGLLAAPQALGEEAFDRLTRVAGHLEARRRREVSGKHWYLNQVGVDPAARGRGIGSALLRPVLERATAAGWPCYLETFDAASLPFYRRLGFRVLAAGVEPASELQYWTLLRNTSSQPQLNAG